MKLYCMCLLKKKRKQVRNSVGNKKHEEVCVTLKRNSKEGNKQYISLRCPKNEF